LFETNENSEKKADDWFACDPLRFFSNLHGMAFASGHRQGGLLSAVPFGGSYPTYERLGGLLTPGMNSEEVLKILGKPQLQENLSGGQRWKFFDDGPTVAWTCIVDFSPTNDRLRLCYFFNVQCYALTNSLHDEFGRPIDNGKFQDDPFLKMRWDQWYPNQ
jgi:hypothetical protein